MFKAIDRFVRLSLIGMIAILVGWGLVRQAVEPVERFTAAFAGAGRLPLVMVAGQTQQLQAADWISSVGGMTTNATPPTGAGDLETTTLNGVTPFTAAALTTNRIPKATGPAVIGDSSLSDNGTQVLTAETMKAASLTLNASAVTGAGDLEVTTINGAAIGTGSVSSVACGVGLTCSPSPIIATGTISPNTTATTCTNGQAFISNVANGTHTCGTTYPNAYAGTFLFWSDEWLYQQVVSATGTTIGFWDYTSSGAGAQLSSSGTTTRPGIELFATGTATTGRSGVTTATALIDFGSGTWDFQTTLGFSVLDDGTDNYGAVMGFSDGTASLDSTDGCYFMYDKQNTATGGTNTTNLNDLECWCSQNSTRTNFVMDGTVVSDGSFTTVAAPVAALTLPSTNIITMEVRMSGNTEADFYVNGTKSCVITHNIPTGSARLTGAELLMIKSAGTTSRNMVVDQTQFSVLLNSARSP